MKKRTSLLLFSVCLLMLALAMTGCKNKVTRIGVSMPSDTESRWMQDGPAIKQQLQGKNYEVNLQNARNDVNLQISQIEDMINDDCKILVIAAINGSALKDVLQKAANKGIKIIAYDRLIMDTANIDYYVTFNNEEVGEKQAQSIIDEFDLEANDGKTYNIEIFAGSNDDNNSNFFYSGAMKKLQKYLDSGKLIVKSGETSKIATSIEGWDAVVSETRMAKILADHYSSDTVDIILSPNDGLVYSTIDGVACGILEALRDAGYGTVEKPYPYITGQDCAVENIKKIIQGEQSMSIFKDTRALASRTAEMIDDLLTKQTTQTNFEYNNNVKNVKTFTCEIEVVNKDNYVRILIESGYYKASDLQ